MVRSLRSVQFISVPGAYSDLRGVALSLPRLPSSVPTSKFRIPQVLHLPLVGKLPGCVPTIPTLGHLEVRPFSAVIGPHLERLQSSARLFCAVGSFHRIFNLCLCRTLFYGTGQLLVRREFLVRSS
jgi:hypothetical protein